LAEIEEQNANEPEELSRVTPIKAYRTRSGRVVRPPEHYGFEKALATAKEWYKEEHMDTDINENQVTIKIVGMMKAMLFQHAMKVRLDEAMNALRDEVKKALKIDIWKPVHMDNLNEDEKQLVLPMMMNYLEKYRRGAKQFRAGETVGSVARIESIKMVLSIAAYEDMAVFKVDIGSAFMQTPMVDDVKHKWVQLDKIVVKMLQELHPGKYEPYIMDDGTIIMEMTKISYGLIKAVHYWYQDLRKTFLQNDYYASMKDKYVFLKRAGDKVSYCTMTVDDCCIVAMRDDAWIGEQIEMLRKAYEAVEIE
jgi:dihydroxyacetone kinase DhaKLM complex PTS-EIIA-like component DhaM